jgi:hypothetical protein
VELFQTVILSAAKDPTGAGNDSELSDFLSGRLLGKKVGKSSRLVKSAGILRYAQDDSLRRWFYNLRAEN